MKTSFSPMRCIAWVVGLCLIGMTQLAAAPIISVTGATVSPGSVEPGDAIEIELALANSQAAQEPAVPGDTLAAGTSITATITFTHMDTGTQFVVSGTGQTPDAIDPEGNGTVKISGFVPTQTTDQGGYRIDVAVTAPSASSYSSADQALTLNGSPDFVVTSLTYPAGISYEGGDTIPMSLTYTNRVNTYGSNNVPYVPGALGFSDYFRIEVILSSNPTFGDADDFLLTFFDIGSRVDADGVDRTLNWTQLLPGNFPGSFYVIAKIDTLEQVSEVEENNGRDDGNNVWLDPEGTRIALDPTNFPTVYWTSDEGNNWSDQPVTSEDGRYTVFASDSTNLVDGDGNNQRDIFVYDQQTSTIRRLNVSEQGAEGNGASQYPFISANANRVAFSSEATNLVLGDTNGFSDIYVVTTFTGAISRVSLSSTGTQANGSSFRPALSQDGRYVVFESSATNLVTGGTATGVTHIFLRDTQTGTTELISVDGSGAAGNDDSTQARVSADGRYVVFASDASNLVAGDANGTRDIFVRDRTAGTTTRVSVATGGTEANGFSRSPSLTSDGGMVAFSSAASNLVAGDTNGIPDIFVHTVATGVTTRVSISSAGAQASDPSSANFQLGSINPSISATGRFVAFASLANNLTDGDAVGQYQGTDSNRSLDIFVHDRDVTATGTFDTPGNIATEMVSRNRFGYQTLRVLGEPSTAASDIFPAISSDGRWVAFPSDAEGNSGLAHGATNRTSPDTNDYRDVFLHDRRINALPNPGNDPTVSITAPINGGSVAIGSTVSVVASASAPAGTVASVEFFVNGSSIGTVTQAPYSVNWSPTVAATYTLSALVIDSFGNRGVSGTISVTVSTTSPATPSVTVTSPSAGAVLPVNTSTTINATASDSDGTIASVEFFANGQSLGIDTNFPYSIAWTPQATGSFAITAEATDDGGNTSVSAIVLATVTGGGAPSATLTAPGAGSSFVVGTTIPLSATASAVSPASVQSVRFLANGQPILVDAGEPYVGSWTPVASGVYALTVEVTDSLGNVSTSASTSVSIIANGAPTVALTSPVSGTSAQQGTPLALTATALDLDGLVANVTFLVNGVPVGTAAAMPYTAVWTPPGPGNYSVVARATDNSGNFTDSVPVVVTVAANGAPTVELTFPANGATTLLGNGLELQASASDSNGSIAAVEFFANGVSVGRDTTGPFTANWVPNSTGLYRIRATATDNGGSIASTSEITVAVLDADEAETLYSGIYIAGFESGNFTVARQGDRGVIFVGYTDSTSAGILGIEPRIYHYNVPSISAGGNFSQTVGNATVISGTVDGAAAYGTFAAADAQATFSGALSSGSSDGYAGPTGVIYGSLTDNQDSELLALVGPDASVTFYARKGTAEDVSLPGSLAADGSFDIATVRGGTISGMIDPETGFLSGTLTNSPASGALSGAASTPTPAADGFLRNLSTRGHVGTGQSVLVAGFVVNGSTPKRLLVRAIGPTLGTFNVSGAVADPVLQLYRGETVVATNDNWGDAAGVPAASATVGAFALPSGSADAALVATLQPGAYTAQVSGAGGSSGVGLVELYDVDTQTPFSAEKVLNVSTRGEVGTGSSAQLIAGVTINGTTAKRVLIRAIGPTLSEFGIGNPLNDPVLRIVRQSDSAVVRENDDWEVGNDVGQVTEAGGSVGAFALPSGSQDAVLLITLPPGAYTALVSSGDGDTGVAIVEVYEVP
ncbi:beta strand repeat-containing protein [Actomonas aquatica]|uniref:Ig-like domain-containing protein n=1 Tax=Actomonas aquatica TaxID=2866162 RepID=A0ABZ1C560_9BACT|nr:Ig-like domain-containing protein [Opitutus sp. WL0086]WRQ86800.1 Ig-like domain-containing protein [Opitutus sp. WL0086]